MNIKKFIRDLKNRFGFARKTDKNDLLPKNKKEIVKLSEKEKNLLKEVEKLDHKIVIIQNSSRTLIPYFIPWHHHLRRKFKWYYNWHLNPHAKKFHWTTLFLAIIFSIGVLCLPKSILAAGYGVTGQAQTLNTNSTVDFSGYNANIAISTTNGQFSGYAWSEDIGWVAFGTQDNPDGPVIFNSLTCTVSGKARVLNDGTNLDFNSAPYNSNVEINSGNFSGYAWSNSLGWINFTGVSTSSNIFAPSSNFTSPTNKSLHNGGTIKIQGTTSGVAVTGTQVRITRDGSTVVNWANASNTGTNFSTWEYDWNINASGTYTVSSRGINCGIESSTPSLILKVDADPPSKPLYLKALDISNKVSGHLQALIDWQAVKDTGGSALKEYEIYRNDKKLVATSHTFYVDQKLKATSYTYQVKAVDYVGNSTASDKVTVSLSGADKSAPKISDIKVKASEVVDNNKKTSALITWKTDTPGTSNVVYGLGEAKANQTEPDLFFNTGHTIVLKDLDPDTSYHFQVISKNSFGNESSSDDQTFNTTQKPEKSVFEIILEIIQRAFEWVKKVMAAPLAEKLGLISSPEQTTPQMLVFDASNIEAGKYQALIKVVNKNTFIIERSTDQKNFVAICMVSKKRDYFLDQNLSPNQTYYYKVRGLEGIAQVKPGSAIDATTKPTITDIKTEEIAITPDKAEVLFSWQTDKLSTSKIEIDNREITDDSLNQSHHLLISDLKPTTSYHFKVSSSTENNQSAISDDQSLTTSTAPEKETIWELILKTLQRIFAPVINWLKS